MKPKEKYYAETSWSVEDVLQSAEENDIKISKKRAEKLLKENEQIIIEAMIATGWDMISWLLNDLD